MTTQLEYTNKIIKIFDHMQTKIVESLLEYNFDSKILLDLNDDEKDLFIKDLGDLSALVITMCQVVNLKSKDKK